jgi:hypothetical protein
VIGARFGRTVVIGALALVTVAVAVVVAFSRRDADATVPVASLTATNRHVLVAEQAVILSLPAAIAQVPAAASDASHGRVSPIEARAIIARTSALAPLARAIESPTGVTDPLLSAYRSVLAGQRPAPDTDLETPLLTLQTVQSQIEPAIRLVAARGRTPASAAATLTEIAHDGHVHALAGLVTQWPQIYGAFALVEQAAAS